MTKNVVQKEIGKTKDQEDECIECKYDVDSRNGLDVNQHILHEGGRNKFLKCCQDFKCEECSYKANS